MTSTRCSLIDRTNSPTLASLIINIHSFCSSFFYYKKFFYIGQIKMQPFRKIPLKPIALNNFSSLTKCVYGAHTLHSGNLYQIFTYVTRTRKSNLRISRIRSLGCSSMPKQIRRLHQTGKETKSLCGHSTSIKIFPKSRDSLIVL